MDTDINLYIFLLYKIISISAGVLSIYWGYKLFEKGLFPSVGDLEAQFGNNKLLLKKGAPGTFFSLFGAVIISISVSKGLRQTSESPISTTTLELPQNIITDIIKVDSTSYVPLTNVKNTDSAKHVSQTIKRREKKEAPFDSLSAKTVDSLYSLAKESVKAKDNILAISYCNMIKGIALQNKNIRIDTSILNRLIEYNIKELNRKKGKIEMAAAKG